MTDPVQTPRSSRGHAYGTSTEPAPEPAGNFLWGAFAFSVRRIRQGPMTFVNAMQGLYDGTLNAYRSLVRCFSSKSEDKIQYEGLQESVKIRFFEYVVEPESCAENGANMINSLSYLESRLKKESARNESDLFLRLRAATLQGSQIAAASLGLPVVGGVIGIVDGLAEILAALSTRRTTRLDARASQTVSRRAELARSALERLERRGLIAALLLEPRYEDKGASYGKTPHSRLQAKRRWDAIVRHYPEGLPENLLPRNRREKYDEYGAKVRPGAIRHAVQLADRILAALSRNEENATAHEADSEANALIRMTIGVASMLLGAAAIAFPQANRPFLLATLGLHGLRHLLIGSHLPVPCKKGVDTTLIDEIMTQLQDRSPGGALGRKFVKAVLRENGMDGAGLQALHFAEVCKAHWKTAWENAHFRIWYQNPDLLGQAERVIRMQLGALLEGSTARDALTHGRCVQRRHLPDPYRRPAVDAFIEYVGAD